MGNTSHLTDRNGQQLEHNLYFPFGESWVSQHRNDDDDGMRGTAYKFTSKELDSETGLYYFGARYYDPRTSLWVSADPILNQYIDGSGNNGVYHPANLGLYNYTYHNPVLLSDPDGKLAWFVTGAIGAAIGSIAYVGRQLYVGEEITAKGLGASALTGLAFGTGAALLPAATAVAGAGLTGYSAGNVGMRAADYGDASPKERRAIQADAALTAVGMLGVRAVAKGGVTKGVTPNAQQAANLKRFQKKIPSNSKESVELRGLPNNGVAAQATSLGKVPGSKAVYEKQLDVNGKTVQATKTTYDPQGNIVHVKDKLNGGTFQ